MRRFVVALGIGLATLPVVARVPAQTPDPVDEAFANFWSASSPVAAAKEADRLVAMGVGFDEAWARLKKGRTYRIEPKSEMAYRWRSTSNVTFANTVDVPDDYDPARAWPVRVQLHGGVGRPSPTTPGRDTAGGRGTNRIAGESQIYVHPSAWAEAQWWDTEQVDNILRLVDVVKRRYNVDESRLYLTGISDGATGAYYLAMKEATPWSSVLPLNGSMAVLRNPGTGADGELYGNNLVNTPLFIVNGEQDPLYPVAQVEPHVQWFQRMGVRLVFRPQAGAGHNTAWWPTERAPYETFVHGHPRPSHPEKLSWETERLDRFNRVHWLVIDRLRGASALDSRLDDTGFFRHAAPSGRVDIVRAGNTFTADTRGVGAFTLLLSPDAIDFSKPVTVTVNGKPAFEGAVKKDPGVLLRWAARDNDRTMLYGAELKIAVH